MAEHGYHKLPHTPGLFKHEKWPVWFTLVVHDFDIKYIGEEHAKHLLDAIRPCYTMEVDLEGKLYSGISLAWNCKDKYVGLSMPNYMQKQLVKYNWQAPKQPQHCPYKSNPIKYGTKSNEVIHDKESPLLEKKQKRTLEKLT